CGGQDMAMTPRQSNPLLALVARLLPPAMGLLVACSPSTGGNVSGDGQFNNYWSFWMNLD
ncbi:MAG: hypothetical protein QF879_15930, partial [Candidatus Latescibacteria bacterium]|nr:hypothetical protein [Candidatus Latescibacterota bacterium]